jgi:hypothetical protein
MRTFVVMLALSVLEGVAEGSGFRARGLRQRMRPRRTQHDERRDVSVKP